MNDFIQLQPPLEPEPVWTLLLALRQMRRQWETIPDRLGLGFDRRGQAVVVPVADSAAWIAVTADSGWICLLYTSRCV